MTTLLEVNNLKKYYTLSGGGISDNKFVAALRNRMTNAPKQKQVLHAVDDVSFRIAAGESLGLVGESGCGKSTLVGMLARLSDCTDGRIEFSGKDIGSKPANQFHNDPCRSELQIVFQDPHESLNPRFTAFDTIAEPLRRLGNFSSRKELRAKVEAVAEQVDLPLQLLSRFPHQLSGGQKARVNIARAIALSPKLLILDEPTSALDVSVQAVILKLLVRLKQELGMSYLFVSHDLNVVRLLCDRVIVMYLGQIIEEGPAEEIFTNPVHPYTRALTTAVPGYNPVDAAKFRLEGDPRSPVNPDPNCCRFYGRCPNGNDICRTSPPPKHAANPLHFALCHFPIADNAKNDVEEQAS